jgi:hypothetical protein
MKYKFYCEKCNKHYNKATVDGYSVGGRLMEGVVFIIKKDNNGYTCLGVSERDKSYMKQFDWNYWKKCVEDYIDDIVDADYFSPSCIKCGYDLDV